MNPEGTPDSLFQEFERRPDSCRAVYVSWENIDRVAAYYSTRGYEVTTRRSGVDQSVIVEIVKDDQVVTFGPNQVLMYDHPPVVVDPALFRAVWRPPVEGLLPVATPPLYTREVGS